MCGYIFRQQKFVGNKQIRQMKKILFLTAVICFFYACKPVKLNFEDNYSQWNFNSDSDIVHNVDNGLVFDYFNELSIQSLYNEGMDDRDKNVYYKKYFVNDDDLHFFTKQNFEKDNPRLKFFNYCMKKIPFADSICYVITDNLLMFTVKDSEKYLPDYFSNAYEDDWKNTHVSGTKIVFNDSIVWRNVIAYSQKMILIVVDRFKIKDKIYGIANFKSTVSKKYPFNANHWNITKKENIARLGGHCLFFDQFAKRFIKQNTFGEPTVQNFSKIYSKGRCDKIKIDKTPLPKNSGQQNIFYDAEKKAVFDTENQYVFDLAKDTVKGFDDLLKGNVNLLTSEKLGLKIPFLTKLLFSVNDKIFIYEFDKTQYLRPNYEFKADEMLFILIDDEYTVKGHEDIWSPNHKKKQLYNFIWRNLYFYKDDLYVVDRMLFQDKGIAAVYKLERGKDYLWNFSEIKNCINTTEVLDGLEWLSRRFVLSNNYWTVAQ